MQTIHFVIGVGFLANMLAACTNAEINRMLNGSSATATQQQRQPYGVTGTITTSEAPVLGGLVNPATRPDENGLYRFAQPQSRKAITSRIGFGNSYQGDSDYYSLNGGEAEIVYDAQGRAIGFRQQVGRQP